MCAFDRESGPSSAARRRAVALCGLAPVVTSSALLLHRNGHGSDASLGLIVGISFGLAIVSLARFARR